MERKAALGVRQEHAMATRKDRAHELRGAGHLRTDRQLQQNQARARERERGQGVVVEFKGAREGDLGAGSDLEWHARARQGGGQGVDGLCHARGCRPGVGVIHVRGADDLLHPVGGGHARHLHRLLQRARAIIDPREQVAVQIDHRVTAPGAPRAAADPSA